MTSSTVVTPVSTSRLAAPTRFAPSMSVSSRSPTTSGRREPSRSTDSRCSVVSGLPATIGRHPLASATTPTRAPLPGAGPRGRGDGEVDVAGDPRQAGPHGRGPLGEHPPPDVRREPLGDRDRGLVEGADRLQGAVAQRHLQPLAADDEDPGAGWDQTRDDPCRRLRRGHDVGRDGADAESAEMGRHRLGRARGVVRHERHRIPAPGGRSTASGAPGTASGPT